MIISHPTGNQNVRNAAIALYRANKLDNFYTTVAWQDNNILSKILPKSVITTLKRRQYEAIPKELISTYPIQESCRLLAMILKIDVLTKHETGVFCIDAVYNSLDSYVARHLSRRETLDGVYAYENGALKTFQRAKQLGITTNYEVASAYLRSAITIFQEEAELNPDWAATIGSLDYSSEYLDHRDEEIMLADNIIVASKFTANNLAASNIPNKRISIIPFGSPEPILKINPNNDSHKALKVLFVGSLTQGKGLSYLFDAIKLLKDKVSLTVIGRRAAPCAALDNQLQECRYVSSLPHNEILLEMQNHDVFVFPSLCDGFGLVILEAMSQGIPVIASTNSGGPDVITDGKDGFVVPIRSHNAIAEKLELLANDSVLLTEMKHAALAKAKKYSWEHYQNTLVKNVIR